MCINTQLILYQFRCSKRQTAAYIAMYADSRGCSHTSLCTISSLYNTHVHAHTPSVLLTWLMDKMERTFGWVTEPEGSLFKKLWEGFYFCSKLTTKSVLHSAALCCLLRKLQTLLSSLNTHNLSASIGARDRKRSSLHRASSSQFTSSAKLPR